MTLFCNLFIERPSYIYIYYVIVHEVHKKEKSIINCKLFLMLSVHYFISYTV